MDRLRSSLVWITMVGCVVAAVDRFDAGTEPRTEEATRAPLNAEELRRCHPQDCPSCKFVEITRKPFGQDVAKKIETNWAEFEAKKKAAGLHR